MNQQFTYVENKNLPDKTAIKLIDGKYADMIYIYGNVKFSEDVPPIMKFDYEVLSNPGNCEYKDSEDFEYIIGDILVKCIEEQLEDD